MKKNLLFIVLFFISANAYSIIYWQPYPVTAVVQTNGSLQQRIHCSVYDSLLGSWKYYNTPYFNTSVNTAGSTFSVVVFNTYHAPSIYNLDSIYGYIIYDQELHSFAPVITSNTDPDYPGASVYVKDDAVKIETRCCYYYDEDFEIDSWSEFIEAYIYDIKTHAWKGGIIESVGYFAQGGVSADMGIGSFIGTYYNDYDYDPAYTGHFFDPTLNSFKDKLYWYAIEAGGDQDLYYGIDSDMLIDDKIKISAYDPFQHAWNEFYIDYFHYTSLLTDNGIFHIRDFNSEFNFFGIYDDSLHQWKVDTVRHAVSNVQIKDGVVAFVDNNKIYYEVFSPTLRSWVKDSTAVNSGIASVSIQEGTVKWVNGSGVTHKAGYNDATGWGNFNTPLLLNFHLTDLYSSTGDPLIFVRNYSIGADSVQYNFGDGIVTDWQQNSLWHLYKVNGHYVSGGTNYTVCISANTSSGIQTSCRSIANPCSGSLPSAAITVSGPTTFCSGGSVLLSSPAGANKIYQWKKAGYDIAGATSSSYSATTGGNYKVTVTNTNTGCVKASANEIPVTVYPLPYAAITPQGPTTFCTGDSVVLKANTGTGLTYKWKKGGSYIPGETLINYTATTGGVYKVKVTNSNGCAKLSAGVTITVPCKEGEELNAENIFDVKVFPNPSAGVFTIKFSGKPILPVQIEMMDALGKVVERFETKEERVVIDKSNLANGIYCLTVRNNYQVVVKKINIEK